MLVGGVDEAGRGSLLGPMGLAIVVLDPKRQGELLRIGVRDSKKLSNANRRRLVPRILEMTTRFSVLLAPHWSIDMFLRRTGKDVSLNKLELVLMAKLISRHCPDVLFVDSPDPRPRRFSNMLSRVVSMMGCKSTIMASNGADVRIPVVAAASILAKVARDDEIARYSEAYGNVGSGYPHDPRTISFVENWERDFGEPPFFTRLGWRTMGGKVQKPRPG